MPNTRKIKGEISAGVQKMIDDARKETVPRTAIISIFRPDVAAGDEDNPFSGIEIVAIEEATGGDYEDIIAPLRKQHPNAQFHIEEVQL